MTYMQPSIWPIDVPSQFPFNVHIDTIDVHRPSSRRPPGCLTVFMSWCMTRFSHSQKTRLGNTISSIFKIFSAFSSHINPKFYCRNLVSLLTKPRPRLTINLLGCKARPLVTHLTSLLEPNGYIQWTEQDVLLLRALQAVATSVQSDSAAERMIEWYLKPREDIDFRYGSCPRLYV